MGLSMRELMTLDIVARDDASPTIEKVSAASKAATVENGLAYKQASIRALTYSKVLRGVSKGLTLYGAAAVAISAFAGKQAVDFQKQMGLVRTQTDLTNKQFQALSQGVLSLATKTAQPIDNLTQGLYDIFSGITVTGPQALNMLKAISKAATAGDTDIRTTTRAAVSEMNAFGLGAGSVNKVLDQQFQLLRFSQGTYGELVNSIGNVLGPAKAAGQSLTQMNAAVGFLTKNGQSFSRATISVGRAMDMLTKPDVTAKLKSVLGVDIINAQGNFKKLSVIMNDMAAKLKGKTGPEIKKALSDVWGAGEIRANRFFNAVIPNIQAYNKNLKETAKFHGAMQNAYDKLKHTTSVQWDKMINQLKVVAIQFGSVILPAINNVIAGVSKIFTWISKLSPATKATVGHFVIWSGIIALILSRVTKLAAGFLSIVSMRLWSGMAAGAEGAASSIGKLGSAVGGTLLKFGLWGAVIAGLVVLFIKNFSTIKSWFEGFINWWKEHWRRIWNEIKPIVTAVAKGFMTMLKTVGQAIGAIVGTIGKFVGKLLLIKPVVQGVVTFLLAMIGVTLVKGIINALATIMIAFIDFGRGLAVAIKTNWVTLLIAALVTAAILIVQNWSKVKDFFAKLFNGLARDAAQAGNFFIRFFVNPVIQGVNTMIHALNFLSLGQANISTLKPVKSIPIPDKYISMLNDANTKTSTLAGTTRGFGSDAAGAAGNVKGLSNELTDLTHNTKSMDAGLKSSDKAIRGISKVYHNMVQNLINGKQVFFDTAHATGVQAEAMAQANKVIATHTNAIIKNKTEAREWITLFNGAQNVTLKTRDHILSLIQTVHNFGGSLNNNEKSWIGQNVAMGHSGIVIKQLQAKINGLKGQLSGMQGPLRDVGAGLDKMGKKTIKPKVEIDTKQIKGQITEQGTALDNLGKKTAKPKVALDPKQFKQNISDVVHMIDSTDKKKAVPKVDANDTAFVGKTRAVASEIARLNSQKVVIPIDVRSSIDAYAYGYAIGQQVAAGARAALQSKSPSKVFMKIGKDVIRGLIIGLRHAGSLKELDNTVGKITDIVKSMPEDLRNAMQLLGKGTSKALDQATKGFQHFMDKIDNLKNLIGTLKDSIQQHIKDIQSKLKDLDKAINDKSTKTAERAADILKKNKLEDQLKKWMDVSHLPSTLQGVASKLQSWGNDLQRRMTALNNRVQSFVGDFRTGFQQGTDIVGILGGETDRKNINIRKFFRDKIATAKKWAGTLRQLARKGLNPALLQELAAAGPDALPLAQEILKIGVKFVNKQQGVLNNIMGQTQKYLVNTVFGDQIDQLAKEAKNFKNALAKLVDIIKRATEQANSDKPPHKPNKPGGSGNFEYHYHAPPKAETKEQIRELSWWWRTHRYGR